MFKISELFSISNAENGYKIQTKIGITEVKSSKLIFHLILIWFTAAIVVTSAGAQKVCSKESTFVRLNTRH